MKGGRVMFVLGTMVCQDQAELESALGKLKGLPIKVSHDGMTITAEYEPDERQSDREEQLTIVRMIEVLESAKNHGISTIAQRR